MREEHHHHNIYTLITSGSALIKFLGQTDLIKILECKGAFVVVKRFVRFWWGSVTLRDSEVEEEGENT